MLGLCGCPHLSLLSILANPWCLPHPKPCLHRYTESFSTTGAASRSFTSTYAAVHTAATRTLRRLDRNPTKKGYVRVHTNLGEGHVMACTCASGAEAETGSAT